VSGNRGIPASYAGADISALSVDPDFTLDGHQSRQPLFIDELLTGDSVELAMAPLII
jgi:hypothetical protein